ERGVQLIATAHGNSLDNLLQNPTLADLVGGIQAVTLSDEEARRRGTQKTVLERKAPPTFDVVIEIQDQDTLAVHHDVAEVVARFRRAARRGPGGRGRPGGGVEIRRPANGRPREGAPGNGAEPAALAAPPPGAERALRRRTVRVFPYAVARPKLERALRKF